MLSVIVPVYNSEEFLGKCLDSLVQQEYEDLEILLVDDGSTDSSGDICDIYAKNYKRIRVFHKENGGQTSAYLKGIEESHGEYIGFVDSDDWIELNMYSKMMPYFDMDGINLVACRYDKVYDGKGIVCNNIEEDKVYDKSTENLFFDNATTHSILSLSRCNKIFLKEDIVQILPYLDKDIRFVEDNLFNLLYATKTFNKAYVLSDVLYHYRYNPNSTSTVMNNKKLSDMNRVYEILKQVDDKGENLRRINGTYIVTCFIALSAIIRGVDDNKKKVKRIKQVLDHPNLKEAIKNCEWVCHSFAQRVKKFLVKHRMARTYLFAYKIFKL